MIIEEFGLLYLATSYIGNWNNWKTDQQSHDIESLFDELDNTVLDYHNTSSVKAILVEEQMVIAMMLKD